MEEEGTERVERDEAPSEVTVTSEIDELASHSFKGPPFCRAVPVREPWKGDRRVEADGFLRIPGREEGSIVESR